MPETGNKDQILIFYHTLQKRQLGILSLLDIWPCGLMMAILSLPDRGNFWKRRENKARVLLIFARDFPGEDGEQELT